MHRVIIIDCIVIFTFSLCVDTHTHTPNDARIPYNVVASSFCLSHIKCALLLNQPAYSRNVFVVSLLFGSSNDGHLHFIPRVYIHCVFSY